MLKNQVTEERIVDALQKQEAMPPTRHELGGGIYYTCHWIACRETVNKFMNYCPKCGQKIEWGVNK